MSEESYFTKGVRIFLAILVVLSLTMVFFYMFPMSLLEENAIKSFCIENGFDSFEDYNCISEDYISKERVECVWGFYKVDNCRFIKEREVISMEKKDE